MKSLAVLAVLSLSAFAARADQCAWINKAQAKSAESHLKPGTLIALQEVKFTRDAYGPVMVLSCWAKGYQEPLYVVSNMDDAEEACR